MPSVDQAVLASWSFPPVVTTLNLFTALLYIRGWTALRSAMPERFTPWRLASFLGGLATLQIALASPIDAFDPFFVADHMFQHMLLMMVIPPLLLLGDPAIPLLRGLPLWAAQYAIGPIVSWPPLVRLGRLLTHPMLAWLLLAGAMLVWHVPVAYELALRTSGWHETEHATFLVASLLFWWPVCQPWPSRAQWPAWRLPVYLLLADFVNSALSAFLVFSGRVLYPSYATMPRLAGISAENDQVFAGVLMWAIGSIAFLIPAVAITVKLLSPHPPASSDERKSPAASEFGFRRAAVPAFVLLLPLAAIAYAWIAPDKVDIDEAVVRAQDVSGPFNVSVFAAPDPLPVGPCDISVLVQNRDSGGTILDAVVDISVESVGGHAGAGSVRATREQSANKLLEAATVDFPGSGAWQLRVTIHRGPDEGAVVSRVEVASASPNAREGS